ncbi:MAG: CAP domain-containing protein, partial [Methylocystis silviterrae]
VFNGRLYAAWKGAGADDRMFYSSYTPPEDASKNTGAGSGGSQTGTGSSPSGCAGLAGEELAICNEHNFFRAKHGVPPLNWSTDLASNAQKWVNGCHTSKNANGDEFFCHQSKVFGCGSDASFHYGENLSFGWPSRSGKEAVDGWYCEINVYDFNNPVVTGGVIFGCDNNPNKVTGHFTQVVWRESTKLGCARNTCDLGGNSGTLWACEYDPPGNFNASQPGVLDRNVPRPAQGFASRHGASARHDITSQNITAIISDVDLYDVPGGNGRIIGVLRQGQTFPLIECRKDDWCKLSNGWVRGSFVVRNHSQ